MINRQGFALIELMVVMTITGVLIAIAFPLYQNYIVKSQVTAAIAELNSAKSQYELIINNGSVSGSSDFTVSNMFFSGGGSDMCIYEVNAPNSSGEASQALVCKFHNVAAVLNGKFVYLKRNAQGVWSCSTSNEIVIGLKPVNCA